MSALAHSTPGPTPRSVLTPGIEKTRIYTLNAWRSGLRYGNFDSSSTLPYVGPSHVAGQHIVPFFKNQQIIQRTQEWFKSWQPWQQRILLCGLTNRSSTALLESLATTLEPLFHRDFTVDLRSIYPSIPLQMDPGVCKPKTILNLKSGSRKHDKCHAESQGSKNNAAESIAEKPTHEKQLPKRKKEHDKGRMASPDICRVLTVAQILEEVSKQEMAAAERMNSPGYVTVPSPARGNSMAERGAVYDQISTLANKMTVEIFTEIGLGTSDTSTARTVEEFAADLVEQATRSAFTVFCKDVHDNSRVCESSKKTAALTDATHKELSTRLWEQLKLTGAGVLALLPDEEQHSLSQHHNPWTSHTALPNDPHSCGTELCPRHWSAAPCRKVRTANFFTRQQDRKLDDVGFPCAPTRPVQAEVRSDLTPTLQQASSVYLPTQNMYKHSKEFARKPSASGKTFFQPSRSALHGQFTSQIKQLWKWMESWEDHEQLFLFKELLKLCATPVLNYLVQCIYQRLQERMHINWLPDRLLLHIFSQLPFEDIEQCSRVCRRWRYICAVEHLWMVKCYNLGVVLGLTELAELVSCRSHSQQDVDWKLAFLELRRTAKDAKNSVPVPHKLTMQEEKTETAQDLYKTSARTPRKGLAAELANESERLKHGISEGLPQVATRACRKKEAEEKQAPVRSSVPALPSLPTQGAHSIHLVKGLTAQPGVRLATATSLQPGDSRPVMEWLHDRRRTQRQDNKSEVAFDVRPNLAQVDDLLGQSRASHDLRWQTGAKVKDERRLAGRYAGRVKAVKRVRKLQGHMDGVVCLQFVKKRLVTGSLDRSVRVWDIRSGRAIHKFYGHNGGVNCLALDSATNLLYTGSWDMSVMIWDLVYFTRKGILTGHTDSVSCLKLTDKHLLSGSHDATVRVYSRNGYTLMKVLRGHRLAILCLDSDDIRVVTGSADKTIRVTHLHTKACVHVMAGSEEPVCRLLLKSDLIISAGTSGRVLFWNCQTGELEAAIQAHNAAINALSFHDGRFFTASSDMTVREWDLVTMTPVRSLLKGHKAAIQDFQVDSEHMVSCDSTGQIRLWDLTLPEEHCKDVCDIINIQVVNEEQLVG